MYSADSVFRVILYDSNQNGKILPFLSFQVMFRKTGYVYGEVYVTGWHFMDFPMPQFGDYELMVRGRYEGGDGPVRRIRLLGITTISAVTMCLSTFDSCCFSLLR